MTMEILAPVGNVEMLYAAIYGGADAVYLAGNQFGARAYASNFSLEEIEEAVIVAHYFGLKVYATVNTLVKEGELESALSFVYELYKRSVDAVIVQDYGLASLIAHFLPDLGLHSSTQNSVNNNFALNYLKDQGFGRVTLAREVAFNQLKDLVDKGIEIEVFGHGSLCVSYSGKCLMSSMIGDRSGNRGRCAQPCRKAYFLLENGKEIARGYLLSPRDLHTAEDARRLEELGVDSFKIEGRMKRPEYTYVSAKYYKSLLNKIESRPDIEVVSNRSFTKGSLRNAYGKDYLEMYGESGLVVGKVENGWLVFNQPVDRGDGLRLTLDRRSFSITTTQEYKALDRMNLVDFPDVLEGSLVYKEHSRLYGQKDFKEELYKRKGPISMVLEVFQDEEISLRLYNNLFSVKIFADSPDKAQNRPLDYDLAFRQLSKLGETFFFLDKLEVKTDGKSFLSAGELNELRRQAVDLFMKRSSQLTRTCARPKFEPLGSKKDRESYGLSLQVPSLKLVDSVNLDKIDRIITEDLSDLEFSNMDNLYYALGPVSTDEDLDNLIQELSLNSSRIKGIVISNLWEYELGLELGFDIIAGPSVYMWNSYSSKHFQDLGISRVIMSPELSLDEIAEIEGSIDIDIFLYGRPDEMVSQHCPASIMPSCNLRCNECPYQKGLVLKGEKDQYILDRKEKYTRIRDMKPISGFNLLDKMDGYGKFIKIETSEDLKVLDLYLASIKSKDWSQLKSINIDCKEGHYTRGVL